MNVKKEHILEAISYMDYDRDREYMYMVDNHLHVITKDEFRNGWECALRRVTEVINKEYKQ